MSSLKNAIQRFAQPDTVATAATLAIALGIGAKALFYWSAVAYSSDTQVPRSPVAYGTRLEQWAGFVAKPRGGDRWYLVVSNPNVSPTCATLGSAGGLSTEVLSRLTLVGTTPGLKASVRQIACTVISNSGKPVEVQALGDVPTRIGSPLERLDQGFALLDSAMVVVYGARTSDELRRLGEVVDLISGASRLK